MLEADEYRIVTETVERVIGLPHAKVWSRNRNASLVFARSVTWLYLYEVLRYSSVAIGEHFGYDHSTVLHNVNCLREKVEYEHRIAQRVELVYQEVSRSLANYTATRLNEQS